MLNFGNVDTEIPLPNSTARVLCPVLCAPSVECSQKWEGEKLNGIVAMSLLKMGEKKNIVAEIWEEI